MTDKDTNVPNQVTINLTDAAREEVERILNCTDLAGTDDFFRKAMTLLRIHIEAAQNGKEIRVVDTQNPRGHELITLPFGVRPPG